VYSGLSTYTSVILLELMETSCAEVITGALMTFVNVFYSKV